MGLGNDIFAGYIKGLGEEKKAAVETAAKTDPANQNETRSILENIHKKLELIGSTAGSSCTEDRPADLAIINGMVVLPDNGIFRTNIYIKDGKVCGLSDEKMKSGEVIDAAGKFVCPGLIDPHVHLGLFAPMETDMQSETKAALMGGVTTTGVFLGGESSHFTSFPEIEEIAARCSYTDMIPHLVISSEVQKQEIREYSQYFGITSFKVYMNGIPGMIPSVNDGFILDVFEQIKGLKKPGMLCCHTENADIVARALKRTKEKYGNLADTKDFIETHPAIAEEEAIIRISYLAEKCKSHVYLVHISSKEGIERLRQIKQQNKYVHVETTSPYLSVTSADFDSMLYKMEPPIRHPEDKEALWKAFEDGIIDTIGTDNVCETKAQKRADQSIWDVIPGYSVLETHAAAVLTEGAANRGIPIENIITSMTKRPAELFGVYPRKGTLLPGSDADIVILDMNQWKEVRSGELSSRSDFSIYEGKKLTGWPVTTIKGGQVMVEHGIFTGRTPSGQIIRR